jgi:peptidoglycan/xylan/chitin deacetylase (PgdA/CDA1 family)
MRRNSNIFGSNKKSNGGRIALTVLFILVVGSLVGLLLFKFVGEGFFASKTPVIVDGNPAPIAEPVKVLLPEDLMEDGNHTVLADKYSYNTADVRNWTLGLEPYSGEKLVFLTFDDGPTNESTDKILDVLKEKGVGGTFFLIGDSIEKTPRSGEIINRIMDEGSSVALHTYTHVYDKLYPGKVGDGPYIKDELDRLLEKIRQVTGKETFNSRVLRFPGGHMTWKGMEPVDELLRSTGIEYIDWNAINGDSEPTSRRPKDAVESANFVFDSIQYSRVKSVVVVLMHDANNKPLTVEALPAVIDRFKAEGFKFGILK